MRKDQHTAYSLRLTVGQNKRGFTLIEMMIAGAIEVILLAIFGQVLGTIVETKLAGQARSAIAEEMRYTTMRLGYQMGQATSMTVPAPNTAGSELNLTINGSTVRYYVEGDKLIEETAGTPISMTGTGGKISNLTFTRYNDMNGKESVKISADVTTSIAGTGASPSQHWETSLGRRWSNE